MKSQGSVTISIENLLLMQIKFKVFSLIQGDTIRKKSHSFINRSMWPGQEVG